MASRTLHVTVPDDSWLTALDDVDGVELSVWDMSTPQPDHHVDLAVRPYTVAAAGLDALDPDRLDVIQSQALGFDGVAETLPDGITYCNAVGVHEESTAELAVALLLASQREIDRYAREVGQWNRGFTASLIDRRILLLGAGGIGRELERRLDGFGAELVRVASTARQDDRGTIHGQDELPDLLPTVDAVLLAVPLTDSTTGLVDDDFLASLPDGAIVVNVSRGKVVDTDAVVRQGGRVRLAADVTDPEPLPPEHPLWTTPGVLISPHVGGMSSAMRPRIEAVVRRQIALLRDGQRPADVVIG
ncbi:NAD(P)-dependent oxidoreductase [Aeromicrobium endophyticum]|uniref:Hydroxyacid dehydrogenase n=1 Tax=Aeromicrobium endophyticum TaxID=2292704 RepID=A0A371P547_9ACTN|nr:NAD(P)-dependent oxidoreductase [Aeromicrobium endophyticum]REK70975.1 hydroxyacid dehydrogenase [Aeromicrobium endophyticum]